MSDPTELVLHVGDDESDRRRVRPVSDALPLPVRMIAGQPHHLAPSKWTPVATSTTSAEVVDDNPARAYLWLQNLGGTDIYVQLGKAASSTDCFAILKAGGGFYEMHEGAHNVFPQAIHAIAASGTPLLAILEGVRTAGGE